VRDTSQNFPNQDAFAAIGNFMMGMGYENLPGDANENLMMQFAAVASAPFNSSTKTTPFNSQGQRASFQRSQNYETSNTSQQQFYDSRSTESQGAFNSYDRQYEQSYSQNQSYNAQRFGKRKTDPESTYGHPKKGRFGQVGYSQVQNNFEFANAEPIPQQPLNRRPKDLTSHWK